MYVAACKQSSYTGVLHLNGSQMPYRLVYALACKAMHGHILL